MPSTFTPEVKFDPRSDSTPRRPASGGGGSRPGPPGLSGWGGGDPEGDGYRSLETYKLGVWIGMGGIVMFFAALISAMVVRRASDDWRVLELPEALWASTAVLLLSSLSFELSKRQLRRGTEAGLRRWITATAVLGAGFLAAQLVGWQDLLSRGIALTTGPSGSFFYLLTAAHGVHVLGGVLVLAYLTGRTWMRRRWPTRRSAIEAAAIYWHFMDVLWLAILALLVFLA